MDDCNDKADGAPPPPPPPPPPPRPPPSHESTRDWTALPRDVLLEILGRLRHADILGGAGLACAEWRRAAVDEPTLWRHIDLSYQGSDVISDQTRLVRLAMGRAAVDRSAGQCESFSCPADRHMLVYLADRAPSLRSLVTLTWCLPKEFSDRVITKIPMLERIELGYGHVLEATLCSGFLNTALVSRSWMPRSAPLTRTWGYIYLGDSTGSRNLFVYRGNKMYAIATRAVRREDLLLLEESLLSEVNRVRVIDNQRSSGVTVVGVRISHGLKPRS